MTEELQKYESEEKELVLPRFENGDALRLGTIILDLIHKQFPGKAIGIYIEKTGLPVWVHLMEGSSPASIEWIEAKKRVVEMFRHSSAYVEEWAKSFSEPSFMEKYTLDPMYYRLCGGSFPIHVYGAGVIGSVTVTGLSRKEDHSLCTEGLRCLKAGLPA